MENLSSIIAVQHKSHSHLQRLAKRFNNKPEKEITKGYMKCVLEEVETIYKSFKEDHEQICALALENTINEKDVPYLANDFYEVFFDTYITFKSKLLDLAEEPTMSHHHMASTFISSNNNYSNSSTSSCAKLPKIELPTFTGEYLEWIPYCDMFTSLVHNNHSLTDIQKYFYLKGSCKDSPLDIINQYPASDRNYIAAWEALKSRYQNKRKLIEQILNKLFSIPQSNGSFSSIKELLDSTRSSLSLLRSLDIDIDTWDPILIYLMTQKMDKQTRKEWEQSISSTELPVMNDLFKFLETTFRTLESVEESNNRPERQISVSRCPQQKPFKRSLHMHNAAVSTSTCVCCQRRHPLYKCFKFLSLSPTEKKSIVSQNNVCTNCLNPGHYFRQCKIAARCQLCHQTHHTILHAAYATDIVQDQTTTALSTAVENMNATALSHTQPTSHINSHLSSLAANQQSQVLLATAKILIKHPHGVCYAKALVDPGSQASFVNRELCQLLNLNQKRIEKTTIDGIGATSKTSIKHMVELKLVSNYNKNYNLTVSAFILPKITNYKPIDVRKCDLPDLNSYQLSDPTFYMPSKIDVLLGSDVYGEILKQNCIKFPNSVLLQESVFGWLVSGPIGKPYPKTTLNVNSCNLENQLRLFWEQEELAETKNLSLEEEACESYFATTYIRTSEGRYEVHLPFRSLLKDSARLFDPLGWLAPTTIMAKIMFQTLWREGLDWTDPLPANLHNEWSKYRTALKDIEKLSLPRWFKSKSTSSTDLHAFCDASKLAFAAVVYIRVVKEDGKVHVSLIQSKTKVAPLKVQTIPKLELCAAVLCARLVTRVKSCIGLKVDNVMLWSDSTTVLNWIKTQSSQLPVYEANRVSQIQRLTNISEWRYVSSSDNPADCATRGLLPEDLKTHTIWWHGPHWLHEDSTAWPVCKLRNTVHPAASKPIIYSFTTSTATKLKTSDYPDYFSKYSSFNRLQRVTAYILRFYNNLKASISKDSIQKHHKLIGCLQTTELKSSRLRLVKICQRISFKDDITCLQNKLPLACNSRVLKLQPFLDDEGVLRVGGRIKHADLSFGKKHPILLTKTDPISYLIFAEAHSKTLHGGVQLMQSYVMTHYWILSARNLAKSVKRNCVTCFKYSAKAATQIMGNLPQVRLNPARPFKHSGLDYAGPINMKQNTLRRSTTTKGLTTDDFLAAFKRFTSRRGPCTDLYSDCGTTFIGASKELQILYHRSKASLPEHLVEGLNNSGTQWHFIPPASPHFGGLWEAGVKSTKHHLRRIMKDRTLTYEELSTLLCQVESCLNSRPLCPLSTDPSDFSVLTPAHFLVGEPTTCIPEDDLLDSNINRLTHWKQIEKLKQHFWQRWSQEYLCRLQSRPKWNCLKREAQIGDIVLLLHERSTPGHWPLARVEEIHPGSDGHCRVVTLYCNGKFIKRPIAKICFLPSNDASSVTLNALEERNT
ncbi:uncharacterized protein LOC131997084 [Stomoxys calcitrans]|uniref:uncharacterized protein LOC131997084 n=1 Tax=Stomoxys calcitrans TaxID=35570 RepID=UPI0027E36973|nr:uncharacterized protein LOC131997084 [Stomoxys calcitrans]